MQTLPQQLRTILTPLHDPIAAAWQTKYMKYHFPFLGIRNPILKKTIKTLLLEKDQNDWRDQVLSFWQEPEREFHYAALEWAIAHKKEATVDDIVLYEQLILSNSWWDTVDTIAPHLVGSLLLRYPSLISKTEEWLTSKDMWLKRTALLYPLRWKEKTDPERLFLYCNHLAHEKEFFIRKAIGWTLREYAKTDPEKVREYVLKTALSPLSKREALKHITI